MSEGNEEFLVPQHPSVRSRVIRRMARSGTNRHNGGVGALIVFVVVAPTEVVPHMEMLGSGRVHPDALMIDEILRHPLAVRGCGRVFLLTSQDLLDEPVVGRVTSPDELYRAETKVEEISVGLERPAGEGLDVLDVFMQGE